MNSENLKTNWGQFIPLVTVFFFWGFVAASNDILIPVFKTAFNLSQGESQLVAFAFYIAYTVGSLIYMGVSVAIKEDLVNKIEKIVILYKDRLLRFGFEIIENLCKDKGTIIEIIDNTEKTEEQELVEDLVQIITVFSCKLNGKRANKAKKLIKELISDDII